MRMTVLVYGTGIMGKGITTVFAQKGYKVLLFNHSKKNAISALEDINIYFQKQVEKRKILESDRVNYLENIEIINDLKEATDVKLAIEAVSEDINLKKKVISEIDNAFDHNIIIASNTSSLSITELSVVTKRPENVVGLHFFNPAPIMNLVEIIQGMLTDVDTIDFVRNLAINLEKKPVIVIESPGFIVNRMLIPMINEAIVIYSEGVASIEDIDTAMMCGANHPIGPLKLADLIGLDVCLSIMETLHSEFGLDKYCASPLLRKMVRANKLGRKTKIGFYKY